jgi:hypothetical protein
MPSLETLEIVEVDAAPMMEAEDSDDEKTVAMEEYEEVSRDAAFCQSDLQKALEAELTIVKPTVRNEEEAVPLQVYSDSPKKEPQVVVQQTNGTSHNKRRVTPTTESNQKNKQQKKVNQMKLGAFFFSPSKKSSPQSKKKPEPLGVGNEQYFIKVTASKPDRLAMDRVNEATKDATPEKPKTEPTPEEPTPESKASETEEDTVAEESKISTRTRNASKKKKLQADSPAKGTESPSQLASEQAEDHGDAKEQPESKATVIDLTEPTPEESSTPSKKRARKSADDDAAKPAPKKKPEPKKELPEDRKVLLQKHNDMKSRYTRRAEVLVAGARGGLDEEDFKMPEPQSAEVKESSSLEDEFPDQAVSSMVLLIEGRYVKSATESLLLSRSNSTSSQRLLLLAISHFLSLCRGLLTSYRNATANLGHQRQWPQRSSYSPSESRIWMLQLMVLP